MKPKVLVIEDNPSDRILSRAFLEYLGFEVIVVEDASIALTALVREKFNLVLLDLTIPGISGLQFLVGTRTQSQLDPFPIIVITGRNDPQIRKLSMSWGAAGFIQKPLNDDHAKLFRVFGGERGLK